MGKSRKIVLQTLTFEKAGEATAFFSDMLKRYKVGSRVSNDDAAHLAALLERHDEKIEKIGVGIDFFEVAKAPDEYPGQCFWIVRTDGSRTDMSFYHCLEKKPYD